MFLIILSINKFSKTLNEKFQFDFLGNNQNVIEELFPQLTINKSSNSNNLLEFVQNSNEDILKNQSKQSTIMNDLFRSGAIKTNIPRQFVNIMHKIFYIKNSIKGVSF